MTDYNGRLFEFCKKTASITSLTPYTCAEALHEAISLLEISTRHVNPRLQNELNTLISNLNKELSLLQNRVTPKVVIQIPEEDEGSLRGFSDTMAEPIDTGIAAEHFYAQMSEPLIRATSNIVAETKVDVPSKIKEDTKRRVSSASEKSTSSKHVNSSQSEKTPTVVDLPADDLKKLRDVAKSPGSPEKQHTRMSAARQDSVHPTKYSNSVPWSAPSHNNYSYGAPPLPTTSGANASSSQSMSDNTSQSHPAMYQMSNQNATQFSNHQAGQLQGPLIGQVPMTMHLPNHISPQMGPPMPGPRQMTQIPPLPPNISKHAQKIPSQMAGQISSGQLPPRQMAPAVSQVPPIHPPPNIHRPIGSGHMQNPHYPTPYPPYPPGPMYVGAPELAPPYPQPFATQPILPPLMARRNMITPKQQTRYQQPYNSMYAAPMYPPGMAPQPMPPQAWGMMPLNNQPPPDAFRLEDLEDDQPSSNSPYNKPNKS